MIFLGYWPKISVYCMFWPIRTVHCISRPKKLATNLVKTLTKILMLEDGNGTGGPPPCFVEHGDNGKAIVHRTRFMVYMEIFVKDFWADFGRGFLARLLSRFCSHF